MHVNLGKFAAALMAIAVANQARRNAMLRASPTYPHGTRRAGDLAHKRWKRRRAAGRG